MFIFSHLASKQPRVPLTPVQRRKIAIFLIVLGAMIELGGAGFLLYTGAWFERTVVAQGMVTAHLTHRGSKGSVSYSEVVVFSTPSGAAITFNDSYSSSSPHAKGVSVPVLYDASDPSRVRTRGLRSWMDDVHQQSGRAGVTARTRLQAHALATFATRPLSRRD